MICMCGMRFVIFSLLILGIWMLRKVKFGCFVLSFVSVLMLLCGILMIFSLGYSVLRCVVSLVDRLGLLLVIRVVGMLGNWNL